MKLRKTVYYGSHRDEKFSFLVFFQFLVSRREMGDEKREIDFLHILPNFGQILVLFEDFSKYNQHFRGFWGHISWNLGSKKLDSFDLVYLDYFIALLVPELQSSKEGNFSRFFLVSREKWLKISRFSREIKMREICNLYSWLWSDRKWSAITIRYA